MIGIVSILSNCAMLGVHSFGDGLPTPLITVTTGVIGAGLLLATKLCLRLLPDPYMSLPRDA